MKKSSFQSGIQNREIVSKLLTSNSVVFLSRFSDSPVFLSSLMVKANNIVNKMN